MRHGEQAWTIGVGRDALRGVEASLQQAGAHLKTWCIACNGSNAARQRFPERLLLMARGGLPLLQDLPFQSDAFALAPLQDRDQVGLLFLQIFLGIDAPVDGEPALLRYHVEVCAAAALSSQHQNRMACLIRPDVEISGSPLHLLLQLLKPLNDAMHAFERILALMLQTNMCGFPQHPDAQRNRATVGVPNGATGRLCQERADAAAAQSPLRRQPSRAAFASRLFIGNQRQSDSPV